MYDIELLKRELPFCDTIHFEAHEGGANDPRKVILICEFNGGMHAKVQTDGMPPTSEDVIHIVTAAAQQCLAGPAMAARFEKGKEAREIKRELGGGVSSSGPRLLAEPKGAPSLEEVIKTVPNVITTDGHEVYELPPPPPPEVPVDGQKMSTARAALDQLLKVTE